MPLTFIVPTGIDTTSTFTMFSAVFTSTVNASSTITGALRTLGGLGVGGNVHIGGTLNVPSQTANTVFAAPNGAAGVPSFRPLVAADIPGTSGNAGSADQVKTIRQPLGTAYYLTFVDSDNSLATNETVYTSSTIYFNPTNGLTIANTTQATTTTNGALVVSGGAGINGNLYVGGDIVATRIVVQLTTITTTLIQTDDIISTYNTTNATSTSTGSLIVSGGVGIGKDVWINGQVNIINGTESTTTGSGALIVTGGVGIGKNIVSRGSMFIGSGTITMGTAGEIRASNEITAYYGSDINLKENLQLITNPLDKLSMINGYKFDWRDFHIEQRGGEDGYFVRKQDVGVIAQEIEKILPEIVGNRSDGFKAVKYEKIIPLLIEAIKEQQKYIDQILEVLNKHNIK